MNQEELRGVIEDLSRIEKELHDAGEHEWAAQIGGNRDTLRKLAETAGGVDP